MLLLLSAIVLASEKLRLRIQPPKVSNLKMAKPTLARASLTMKLITDYFQTTVECDSIHTSTPNKAGGFDTSTESVETNKRQRLTETVPNADGWLDESDWTALMEACPDGWVLGYVGRWISQ